MSAISFKAPQASFGALSADEAATLVAAGSDVALVLNADGVIQDVAFQSHDFRTALQDHGDWIGRAWIDTVTTESRAKVTQLLTDATDDAAPRWRHVNHPGAAAGADVPVLIAAVRTGPDERVIAFGRDLRVASALQQRLIDAQASLERDYARLREAETRYRLLFQASAEAVLVVDAATYRIMDVNPAARRQLQLPADQRQPGRMLLDLFSDGTAAAAQGMLATVRATGQAGEIAVQIGGLNDGPTHVAASLFRESGATVFLVRLTTASQPLAGPQTRNPLLALVESAPDGFVVTGADGRVSTANAAFLTMAQLATEAEILDRPLSRWLGREGVDLDVLFANLRKRGVVRLYATVLRGEFGAETDIEVSAVALAGEEDAAGFGFAVRDVGRRLSAEPTPSVPLPRSATQLTELIGRVSLKDLVRETTDVIEKLCIETALEMTNDNRASAAEMLGLSRQSFYVKMRQYGLGDLRGDIRGEFKGDA